LALKKLQSWNFDDKNNFFGDQLKEIVKTVDFGVFLEIRKVFEDFLESQEVINYLFLEVLVADQFEVFLFLEIRQLEHFNSN
jgi:hypothetical protein